MTEAKIRLPKPRKQRSGCLLPIAISVAAAVIAAGLIGLGTTWTQAFNECAKTEIGLRTDYVDLSWEIFFREERIAQELMDSKTISDVRARLDEPYYQKARFKDKTLAELRVDYILNQDRPNIVEGDDTYRGTINSLHNTIIQLPRYDALQSILNGEIQDGFRDTDMNDLRVIMVLKAYVDFYLLFLGPLRTVYKETCTLKNVTLNCLGMNRLTYRGTLTTLTNVEENFRKWSQAHPESD